MPRKPKYDLLPRSILSSLHEPLMDPKDGHGARSKLDLIILRKWDAAKKGDDDALIDLLKLIVRESLFELKSARKKEQRIVYGGESVRLRSLVSVMTLLGMITSETVSVPPERDGYATVTKRQQIRMEPWFEAHALERPGLDPELVEGVRDWLARGGIQRPHRLESD